MASNHLLVALLHIISEARGVLDPRTSIVVFRPGPSLLRKLDSLGSLFAQQGKQPLNNKTFYLTQSNYFWQ